jgi:hypothetical protein
MNTIHAVLCEDFGQLDAGRIRDELLAEAGICGVTCENARHRLRIEYDPVLVNHTRLKDLMCRHALFPAPVTAKETT